MLDVVDKRPVWRTVWFALTVGVVLLVLSLIPTVSQTIEAVDQRAAVWFNSGAGVSPVFDRFVLLFADDDGQERIAVLAVIWFLIMVWRAPTRLEKSRLLGMLLFLIVVLVPYFLIDSLLDDVIERKSPSIEFLNPFNDIGKILDHGGVDLTDKRSFPNATGMILLTIGFVLVRLKHTRGGLVALALGLTLPLLHCVAGLSWVTDIYLGALPLSFLVSAVAVETPFRRVFGSLVESSAAGFDQAERFGRSIGPMWRHRKLYWSSQNVLHMEVAVKRFVSHDLRAIIDPDKRHPDEEITLEVPLSGLRSVVRIVALGPVKSVLRAYPLSARYDADQHFRASTLLQKNGIRVPAIYHRTESARKYGAIFLVEEFIDGSCKQPEELTDDDIKAAAVELANLHQVRSEVWGPITAPRTEDFGTVVLRRVDRQLNQFSKGTAVRDHHQIARVRAWIYQWREQLSSVRYFSLIHGKLHRENCIFETSGRFCLLDITTLEWGISASDLVTVHYSQCGNQPDLTARFDRAYYAELPPEEAETSRRFLPLFEALHCISQITKYRKRLGRGHKRHPGDAIKKEAHWWNHLVELVEHDGQSREIT